MAIKMYRAKELPTTLTTAHDGLWYIKPDGNHPFKLYMVKGGVPYEGSFAPPTLQEVTDAGNTTTQEILSGSPTFHTRINNFGVFSKNAAREVSVRHNKITFADPAFPGEKEIFMPYETLFDKGIFLPVSLNNELAGMDGDFTTHKDTLHMVPGYNYKQTTFSSAWTSILYSTPELQPKDMWDHRYYTGEIHGEMKNVPSLRGTFRLQVGTATTRKEVSFNYGVYGTADYFFKLTYMLDFTPASSTAVGMTIILDIWQDGGNPKRFQSSYPNILISGLNRTIPRTVNMLFSSTTSGTMYVYRSMLSRESWIHTG